MIISEMQNKYPNMVMITEDGNYYKFIGNYKLLYSLNNDILVDLTDCNNYDCLHKIAQINGSFIKKIYASFDIINGNIISDKYYLLYDNNENEKPKLSDVERTILENVDKQYKYIARDENGDLFLYEYHIRKNKNLNVWELDDYYYDTSGFPFSNLLKFIKWEDEEPYNIEDLLNND